MGTWLFLYVTAGRIAEEAGGRLWDALAETTTPQMILPPDPVMAAFHPAARIQTYGMGWFVTDFHGMTLLTHGGGIDGMSALVAWVPEAELGVAILTNLQTPTPPTWIFGMLYGVLDPALGVEPTDWRTSAARVLREDVALRAGAGAGWVTFRPDRSGAPAELELVAIPGETERLERVGLPATTARPRGSTAEPRGQR